MEIKDCRVTDTHVFFWGSVFSNWYPCIFIYFEERFNNSEQAFMWEKANFFGDEEMSSAILKETNPRYAKAFGRKVKGFNVEQWMINSFMYMVAVNYAKFTQNQDLKEILLSTGDRVLVEASPYDKIWGIGLQQDDDRCLDENQWQGMNLLGRALMEVRKQINEEENEDCCCDDSDI